MGVRLAVVPTSGFGEGKYRLSLRPGFPLKFDAFLRFCETSSTVSRADVRATVQCMVDWITDCAEDGRVCDLGPLGRSRLSAGGSFDEPPERIEDVGFQYNIAWVLPRALKRRIREIGKSIDRELAYPLDQRPSITQVEAFDPATSGWRADASRAGGTLRLHGLNLKFDDAADEQGVFLRPKGTRTWTRVPHYLDVFPKQTLCIVPDGLAGAGPLSLQVRGERRPGKQLAMTSTYDNPLEEITR